jgi:hypothetical protein
MKGREQGDERMRVLTLIRNDERRRIAHLAARIMVEDGIENYALAKKKAARQAGVADTRHLPGNNEIDDALKNYQQTFHADDLRDRLQELREKAVRAMQELAEFNPHLCGSVLSGSAGKYADINLQLFTDDAKAVELFLIGRDVDYKPGQTSLYSGEARITVPVFTMNDEGTDIEIAVLSPRDARVPLKTSLAGEAIERAKLAAVEELLAET